MKEALIFGFDLDSYSFYKKNFDVDVLGYFGDIDPSVRQAERGIVFVDLDLYSETKNDEKPRSEVRIPYINPANINDMCPIPVVNSFLKDNDYRALEDPTGRLYLLEAMMHPTVSKGINVLAEPGVIVASHVSLSHGVELKSLTRVRENCSVGQLTTVGERSYIDRGCIIGSNVTIEEDVTLGMGSMVQEGATVRSGVYPMGSVIGVDDE